MKRSSGIIFVEFAFVLPFLVIVVLQMIEMANYLSEFKILQNQARNTARYMTVHQPSNVSSEVEGRNFFVFSRASCDACQLPILENLDVNNVTISSYADVSLTPPVRYITVSYDHQYQPIFDLVDQLWLIFVAQWKVFHVESSMRQIY